jgi:predicted aspartyl protease
MEHWEARPDRNRTELDLKVISVTMGDNGTTAWELDSNGKLRIEQEPNVLARRGVDKRVAMFEHLDPESTVFDVALLSVREIDGRDCYVIRIVNTEDNAERVWFVGTDDFLMWRAEENLPDEQHHTNFSDFREVDGIIHAFRQDVEILPIGQKQVIVTTMLETGVPVDPALFDPPPEAADDYRFTAGGESAEVPFEYISDHIFVSVTLGGADGLWVLDTGASMSVIDRGYAEGLGLPLSGEILGQGAGNTVDAAFTTLPPFSVGSIEFQEQQVAAIDLVWLFRRLADIEVVGILGYDFLSRFVTKVDYANEMLTFYEPDVFEYSGDGTVLDAPLRENIFSVRATVDGVHEGRWMLDLGAGGMTFDSRYAREHGLGDRKGVYRKGHGAGGSFMRYHVRHESVEFGGHTVENPVVSSPGYNKERTGEVADIEEIGNLGNSLFRHFVLYLDYEDQRIIVEKGGDFDRVFPADKSGLQLWRPEAAVEVLYASPGAPAGEAGFAEGDVVLSIDGEDVADHGTLLDLADLLKRDAGTTYTFLVDRDGEQMELQLTLRDLFQEHE